MIVGLKDLNCEGLASLREELELRLREFGAGESGKDGGPAVSGVLEYRPHADGTLQAEVRRYVRKDGSVGEQGPYWYFRYHEGGRRSSTWARPTTRRGSSRASGRGAILAWRKGTLPGMP